MNWFLLGAVLGGVGVLLGAFGAHALQSRVSPDLVTVFETGVRYQMYHAFALIAVAYATHRWPGPWTTASGWLFLTGIMIFSGSLYLLVLGNVRWLGAVTPLGGLCLVAGWLCLAVAAWQR